MRSSYTSDRHFLEKIIEPNVLSITIIFGLSLLLWVLGYAFPPQEMWNCAPSSTIDAALYDRVDPSSFLGYALGWFSTLVIAVLLFLLNERDNMISQRTMLPVFFYVLLVGSNVNTQSFVTSSISNVFVILALHSVFSGYRQLNPLRSSFNIGVFIALASVFCEEYVLLLPFFMIAMLRLNTLNLRTFLASVLGVVSTYFTIFGVIFMIDDEYAIGLYYDYVSYFKIPYPEYEISVIVLLYYGMQIICSFVAAAGVFSRSYVDNIKGSKLLSITTVLMIGGLVLFFLFSNKMPFFYPLMTLFETILLSHYFTLRKHMSSRVLFSSFMSCVALYFLNSIIFQ